MLTDLAQRYKLRGTFREPRDLDRHLAVVEEKKQLLTQYASLVNRTIEPFKATIFEILWARDRCGQVVASHLGSLSHVILPVVVQFTRIQFTQAEHFLSVYAQHLAAVLAPCKTVDRHPWAWIAKPLQFEEEERLLDLLTEFLSVIRKADECCERLHDVAGITLTRTEHGLDHAAYTLGLLPQTGGAVIEELLTPCRSAANRQKLTQFAGQVESFRTGFDRLSTVTGSVNPLLDAQVAGELSDALDCMRQWGLEGHAVARIRTLLDASGETAKHLAEAHSSFRVLLTIVGFDAPVTLSSAAFYWKRSTSSKPRPTSGFIFGCPHSNMNAPGPCCSLPSGRRRRLRTRKCRSAKNSI